MSDDADEISGATEAELGKVLFCTQLLLASLQKTEADGWTLSEKGLAKACQEYSAAFEGPEMERAVEELLNVVGLVLVDLEKPELSQRIVDEVENIIPEALVSNLQERLASRSAEQQDQARQQFAKLLGPPAQQVEIPEGSEKIDFKVPKGSFKG